MTGHRHRRRWLPMGDVTSTLGRPDPPASLGICDICGMPGLAPAGPRPFLPDEDWHWLPGSGAPVIPAVLRSSRFVPRQRAGRREPLRVWPETFTAAGLPVPENPAQRNVYQLTQRQGWPWSPEVDCLTSINGSEILPGPFVTVDCDVHLTVDGSVWLDGFRWLADRATEAGEILDLSACLAVRTPGHLGRSPGHDHGPGWHLWWAVNPDHPVRTGPLERCRAVEIKNRCTSPGSPGYTVRHAPDVLPLLPAWLAELAGPPRQPCGLGNGSSSDGAWADGPPPDLAELMRTGLPVGKRNDLLLKLACRQYRLHGTGPGGHAAVMAKVGQVLATTDTGGFPGYEIDATVDSARRFIKEQEQDEEQLRQQVMAWLGTREVA
jgi:hypothetical protein